MSHFINLLGFLFFMVYSLFFKMYLFIVQLHFDQCGSFSMSAEMLLFYLMFFKNQKGLAVFTLCSLCIFLYLNLKYLSVIF